VCPPHGAWGGGAPPCCPPCFVTNAANLAVFRHECSQSCFVTSAASRVSSRVQPVGLLGAGRGQPRRTQPVGHLMKEAIRRN